MRTLKGIDHCHGKSTLQGGGSRYGARKGTIIFNVLSNTVGIPPFNQVCNQLHIKNLSEEGDKINDMIVISFLCACISLLFHGKKIKE